MGEGGEKWESGEAVSGEVQMSEETIVTQPSGRLIGEEDEGERTLWRRSQQMYKSLQTWHCTGLGQMLICYSSFL